MCRRSEQRKVLNVANGYLRSSTDFEFPLSPRTWNSRTPAAGLAARPASTAALTVAAVGASEAAVLPSSTVSGTTVETAETTSSAVAPRSEGGE